MEKLELEKINEKDGYWQWQFSASKDIFTSEWNELATFIEDSKKHSFYEQAGCFLKVVFDSVKNMFTTFVFIEEE